MSNQGKGIDGEQQRQSALQFGRLTARSPYAGHLKADQIAAGINFARNNGKRLVKDAQLLLEQQSYASAAALAVLAIEELGKEIVLRRLGLVAPGEKTAKFWKDFRNHLEKNQTWILPFIASKLPRVTLEAVHKEIYDESSNHPEVLDWVKQAALYTDCVGGGEWQDPQELFDEFHARKLVELADAMQGERGDVSPEEIVESQEIIRSGVTKEKIQKYVDKYGHKDVLPIS